MPIERITVTGIRPKETSIGQPGIHLRWMFPTHLGFPRKGFAVYRRRTPDLKLDCTTFSAYSGGQKFPHKAVLPGSVSDGLPGMTFYFHNTARLVGSSSEGLAVDNPGTTPMQVTFEKPVTYAEIRFKPSHDLTEPIKLQGYADGRLVAESSRMVELGEFRSIRVSASYITDIVFPLRFAELHAVCAQTEEFTSAHEGWDEPLVALPLLVPGEDALKRLEANIRNRFAADRDEAKERYQDKLPELLEWLKWLGNPSDPVFANPGKSPDQLRIQYTADEPNREVYPQSMLLLAALDPNIAHFLSLYWVDVDGRTGGPMARRSYDYKVVGDWGDQTLSGFVLGVGGDEAELPVLAAPVGGTAAWPPLERTRSIGQDWYSLGTATCCGGFCGRRATCAI